MIDDISWVDRPAYLITDGHSPLPSVILELLKSYSNRVGAIQLREPSLIDDSLRSVIATVRGPLLGAGIALLVNKRIDLAVEYSVGVHLQQDVETISDAKRRGVRLIGYSAHSIAESQLAFERGATFVTLSPIFMPGSKVNYSGALLGLESLRVACCKREKDQPIIALGGIAPGNVGSLRIAGAAGFASISSVFSARDRVGALGELLQGWDCG